jgi:hypothetical protein
VIYLNKPLVEECLLELSSQSEQETLWTSDGKEGQPFSTFTEAICGLYDDSGLGRLLEGTDYGDLSPDLTRLLVELSAAVDLVDDSAGPLAVIHSAGMARVRALALEALGLMRQSR